MCHELFPPQTNSSIPFSQQFARRPLRSLPSETRHCPLQLGVLERSVREICFTQPFEVRTLNGESLTASSLKVATTEKCFPSHGSKKSSVPDRPAKVSREVRDHLFELMLHSCQQCDVFSEAKIGDALCFTCSSLTPRPLAFHVSMPFSLSCCSTALNGSELSESLLCSAPYSELITFGVSDDCCCLPCVHSSAQNFYQISIVWFLSASQMLSDALGTFCDAHHSRPFFF